MDKGYPLLYTPTQKEKKPLLKYQRGIFRADIFY